MLWSLENLGPKRVKTFWLQHYTCRSCYTYKIPLFRRSSNTASTSSLLYFEPGQNSLASLLCRAAWTSLGKLGSL